MAEERDNIFQRLKKLFSSDVIIINKGGRQLKVTDTNRIQSTGNLANNLYYDKYNKIYATGNPVLAYNQGASQNAFRLELFRDYEAMDTDSIISSALDIYADECTTMSEFGSVLTIKSGNEKIVKVLNNLFYDILNVEFNLWPWIRNLCVHENTIIPLLDGTSISIKDLAAARKANPNKEYWVYSVQEGTNKTVPGKVVWCDKTREQTRILRVHLDDGTFIDVTPDHKFILKSGHKKQADQLRVGESLMPFYTKISTKSDTINGYEKVYSTSSNKFNYTHRIVANEIYNAEIKAERRSGIRGVTHHKDFNKLNNSPSNLQRMEINEHLKLHNALAKEILWGNNDIINRRKASIQKWLRSDKHKNLVRTKQSGIYPPQFKEYNESDRHAVHNKKRSAVLADRWKTGQIAITPATLNDDCVNYISSIVENSPNWITISKLISMLKGDNKFNMLFKQANSNYKKNINSLFYLSSFSNLIKNATGKPYCEFVTTVNPLLRNTAGYRRNASLRAVVNHKVAKLEYLDTLADTYCLEVVSPEGKSDRSNFAVCGIDASGNHTRNGVFVSNCKYGDHFLKLDIVEKYGVIGCRSLTVYEVVREEGWDPKNPQAVRFRHDPNSGGLTMASSAILSGGGTSIPILGNHEVAHFRLLSDTNFLPYGKALLEPARKVWKQLTMLEDAMMIHRIMRAPTKRIFSIDVGTVPPNDVDAYMSTVIDKIKKVPYVDPNTGDYNLKFNLQNMFEDFFLPVRGSDSGTKIDTLEGMEFTGIDDVNYIKDRMLAALRVPRAFLNYEESLSGKAVLAAEDIRFAKSVERLQRIVISELVKIAIIHLFVQEFKDEEIVDFELSLTTPSTIFEQEKTDLWQKKVQLASDLIEKKLRSIDWINEHVWNMSDAEALAEKEAIVNDTKYLFRLKQIEEEGNDPEKTGMTYGTPHDIAMLYKGESGLMLKKYSQDEGGSEPGGQPGAGRPENDIDYGTHRHVMGRDPLGNKANEKLSLAKEHKEYAAGIKTSYLSQIKRNAVPLKKYHKQQSTDSQVRANLLSESNILSDDEI